MRTDWIDDLVALIDAGGVADAAIRRNVSQPAFSRRLQAIEEVLDVKLVNRKVRPSGPSDVLKDHTSALRQLAEDQRRLISRMRQAGTEGSSQLAIVCQHAITTSLGAQIVSALNRSDVPSVRLRSANHDECDALLYSQNAAIAVMYQIADSRDDVLSPLLEQVDIGTEKLLPVASKDHAKRLMWDAHQGQLSIIGYPPDVFLGALTARFILPAFEGQFGLKIVAETALSPAAFEMARAGIGVAWVPHALARNDLASGEMVNLTDELGSISLRIVARRRVDLTKDQVSRAWIALTKAFDREDVHDE